MRTQLDERQELVDKINGLSVADVRALKMFIAGMDAGKALQPPKSAADDGEQSTQTIPG